MTLLINILLFILGLVIGSFLTALTERWPHEDSIANGRSRCPKCKKQIASYDNIPLFSYLLLGGKCRNCGKKISIRYPLIEFSTALLFLFSGLFYYNLVNNIYILKTVNIYIGLAFVLVLITAFVAVFVIDLEHQYIPDRITFWGIGIVIAILIATNSPFLFQQLIVAFSASLFLLLLHLITKGRGMGLGDVKLVIFLGLIFTPFLALLWMSLSFIIGSIIGITLIAIGKARLQQQIAFGPFIIVSALLTMFLGQNILKLLLPYII